MVRPRKIKIVDFEPDVTYFKPRAVPLSDLQEVELTIDELESMRLSNLEDLNQSEAAERMQIHQSTFQRTQRRALEKVTDALVNGKAIKIKGGEYVMPKRDGTGPAGKIPPGRGRGRFGAEEGYCVCPDCDYKAPHVRGEPCSQKSCPKCGSRLIRG